MATVSTCVVPDLWSPRNFWEPGRSASVHSLVFPNYQMACNTDVHVYMLHLPLGDQIIQGGEGGGGIMEKKLVATYVL